MDPLEAHWHKLLSNYTDAITAALLWQEIHSEHSAKGRHYHDLTHLRFMTERAHRLCHLISDPDMLYFAIFYHDMVYNVLRKDNEVKSAAVAKSRLAQLGIAPERIAHCVDMIEATKDHALSDDPDTNYFLDLDMAILGTSLERYQQYREQVRMEYGIYPDFLYNKGRKQVLEKFLSGDDLFRTELFKAEFEENAIRNIKAELKQLA